MECRSVTIRIVYITTKLVGWSLCIFANNKLVHSILLTIVSVIHGSRFSYIVEHNLANHKKQPICNSLDEYKVAVTLSIVAVEVSWYGGLAPWIICPTTISTLPPHITPYNFVSLENLITFTQLRMHMKKLVHWHVEISQKEKFLYVHATNFNAIWWGVFDVQNKHVRHTWRER